MSEAKARFRIEGEDATAAAFRSAMRNATTTANRMSGAFKAAFAGISIAAVGSFATRIIETGDELSKAASKSGIAAKAFTELAYAARMSDVDVGGLSKAIKTMQVEISKAGSDTSKANATLHALGVTVADLRRLSPDKQFELLADRIAQLKDPADRARAATEMFGKAGADLLPMFEQGAAGIRKAREEASRFGQSFSEDQLQRLADADDAIKRLKASFEGMATVLMAKVAPGLSQFLDNITAIATGDRIGKLREQINFLERMQGRSFVAAGYGDIGSGFFTAEEGAAKLEELRRKLSILESRADGIRAGLIGARGRRGQAVGYTDAPVEDSAKKAAKTWREKFAEDLAQHRWEVMELPVPALEPDIDLEEAFDNGFDTRIQNDLDNITEGFREATDTWTTYTDQAARNMQDALAQFFFDPFKDGLRGMLKGFVDTLRRMAAEMMASQVFKWLASALGGSSNPILSAIGGFFGGGKAMGGPVSAGTAYVVGERGPELFMPGQSGTIVPNHRMGGGGVTINMAPNIVINGDASLEKKLPAILSAWSRQTVELARRQLNDDVSRGAFGRA